MAKEAKVPVQPKAANRSLGHGVGRRKSSVARVWLKRGSGQIKVNGKDYTEYFSVKVSQMITRRPLELLSESKSYDIQANVNGGGFCSQAGAVMLGIARAFVDNNEELKPVFKKEKLLTVDSRVKERKKYGQRGARRKFQFVKR